MSARSRCSWTGDPELDRIELGDRVADAWASDLALAHAYRLSVAIGVPWFSLVPNAWLRAFGVRSISNTEHLEPTS